MNRQQLLTDLVIAFLDTRTHLVFVGCIALLSVGCSDDPVATTTVSTTTASDLGDQGFTFRTDLPSAYTRVDRAGMPAVSTALIGSANKNAYNDGDPTNDVSGTAPGRWAGEMIGTIGGLRDALDTALDDAGLTSCADGATCATQNLPAGVPIFGGQPVYTLVIPDVLTVDTSLARAFPNGRGLADPVMDVVLNVLLLDLSMHAVDTLATLPLNPPANDVAFSDTFPYLAAPN